MKRNILISMADTYQIYLNIITCIEINMRFDLLRTGENVAVLRKLDLVAGHHRSPQLWLQLASCNRASERCLSANAY